MSNEGHARIYSGTGVDRLMRHHCLNPGSYKCTVIRGSCFQSFPGRLPRLEDNETDNREKRKGVQAQWRYQQVTTHSSRASHVVPKNSRRYHMPPPFASYSTCPVHKKHISIFCLKLTWGGTTMQSITRSSSEKGVPDVQKYVVPHHRRESISLCLGREEELFMYNPRLGETRGLN